MAEAQRAAEVTNKELVIAAYQVRTSNKILKMLN